MDWSQLFLFNFGMEIHVNVVYIDLSLLMLYLSKCKVVKKSLFCSEK